MKTLLDDALGAIDRGWAVVPLETVHNGRCTCGNEGCKHAGKHPRAGLGVYDATTKREIVRDWWALWGDSNLGLATGARSNVFALDVDKDKGGFESLAQIVRANGALPRTVKDKTQSGGNHIIFNHPGFEIGNGKLAQGIDLRDDGGYIVIPASVGKLGRYEWIERPERTRIASAPGWLLDWLAKGEAHAREDTRPAAIRFNTNDGLPRGVWQMLHGERLDQYGNDKSAHEYAIICKLARRGWTFENVRDLFDRTLYDASHYKSTCKNRREALGWLDRVYASAVRFVSTHESADLRAARELAQAARQWANGEAWAGRTGATDRAVYIAHTLIAEYAGKTEYHASTRDLAELAGVNKITASKSNHRLLREGDLIAVSKPSTASLATFYRLLPKKINGAEIVHSTTGGLCIECTTIAPLALDAFRRRSTTRPTDGSKPKKRDGLGKCAAQVFEVLRESPGLMIGEVVKRTGRNRQTVRAMLARMFKLGIVSCDIAPGKRWAVWSVCERIDFEAIAQELGTAGVRNRQRFWHAEERAKHKADLKRGAGKK